MEVVNRYSIYVGSARGTIIYTNLDPDKQVHPEFAETPSEISSMIWGKENEIIVGFKSGIVCTYDTDTQKYSRTINQFRNQGTVVGLGVIDKQILVTSTKGHINILKSNNEFESIMTLPSEFGTVKTSCQNTNMPNIIATGGEMNDLKLWDVEAKQCVFKAKSMGHDFLNLPIKTSVRGITFIPEEQNLCCCVTKEGYILLYDDRAQRRPVSKFYDPKASFTSISTAYKERNIFAGTTKGYIQYVDMKTSKLLKTFTGIAGSVTCLACDPVQPVLFSTSLDRYLRIFDIEAKKVLHKQYLRQNLKNILIRPEVKQEDVDVSGLTIDCIDDEYDEIFNNMEEVTEKPIKRKRDTLRTKLSKKIKVSK